MSEVGRRPDEGRKADLLDAIVDYMFQHGLADLTLRPLAEALGTNARMLIYHFGSREQLITEALRLARQRQRELLELWGEEGTDRSLPDRFRRFWNWLSSPEMEPYVRFFFDVQVYTLKRREAFPDFLLGVVEDWVTYIASELEQQGVPRERAETSATLLVATTRGLLLDLLYTGDRERVDRTFALFIWQMMTTTHGRR